MECNHSWRENNEEREHLSIIHMGNASEIQILVSGEKVQCLAPWAGPRLLWRCSGRYCRSSVYLLAFISHSTLVMYGRSQSGSNHPAALGAAVRKSYYSLLSSCSSIGTVEWCWAKWLYIFNTLLEAERQQASTAHIVHTCPLCLLTANPKWRCWRVSLLVHMPF